MLHITTPIKTLYQQAGLLDGIHVLTAKWQQDDFQKFSPNLQSACYVIVMLFECMKQVSRNQSTNYCVEYHKKMKHESISKRGG
jgi:hypothetical protein